MKRKSFSFSSFIIVEYEMYILPPKAQQKKRIQTFPLKDNIVIEMSILREDKCTLNLVLLTS